MAAAQGKERINALAISKNDKDRRRRLRTVLYVSVLIALLTLLVAATYTWFSLSQTPRVYDMAMFINSDGGLELSLNSNAPDEEWTQRLEFGDMVTEDYPLKPVTWSEKNHSFMTMRYGFDGRMAGDYQVLSDSVNANRLDANGYYVVGTFYARTHTPCSVSLAEAVEVNGQEDGAGTYVIGEPVWDADAIRHEDGGHDADAAIRIGFRITELNPTTGEEEGSEFFIFEPSCDKHISGSTVYFPTPSIDGTEALIDEDHLILQGASSWQEATPVEHGVTVKNLGKFLSNKVLFELGGDIVKVQLYVWLEGQDADCVARVDRSRIFASLQFHVDYSGQSGLDDIEE